MTHDLHCPMKSAVDRHFELSISPRLERELRLHLPECDRCRGHYRRHLIFARLDPSAAPAEDRIARGLGLGRRSLIPALTLALAALAMLLLFVHPPGRDSEFTARGGAPKDSRLLVYHLVANGEPTLVESEVGAGDELAFAYENTEGWRGLLVFGVDEHRHVFWYHPAWRDPEENPTAIELSTEPGVHELPEAVKHDLDGSRLTIHAVFTDEPLSVREIEAALHSNDREAWGLERTIEVTVKR